MLNLTLKNGGFVRIGEALVYVALKEDGRIYVDIEAPKSISIERDRLLIARLEREGYEVWRDDNTGDWTVCHPDYPGEETTIGKLINGGKTQ